MRCIQVSYEVGLCLCLQFAAGKHTINYDMLNLDI